MKSIVQETRKKFEKGEIPRDLLATLYQRYHQTNDIDVFLRRASWLFPKLNCGIASVYLRHKLGKGNVVHGRYAGEDHTFLRIDSTIIDITADQFGGPKIYIGSLVAPWSCDEV